MTAWQFVRYRPDMGRDDWCCYPSQMWNPSTGEQYFARCRSTRRSRCEYCAELHRGDVAAVGRSGVVDNPSDRVFMLTLTAPGSDVLPWDTSRCTHSPSLVCSGRDHGCVVDEHAAALWHDKLTQRWSWWVTEVRRLLGDDVTVEFMKTWEAQERGVLHLHALVRVHGQVRDRRIRAAFKLARDRWGFGSRWKLDAIDTSDPAGAARVAGYIAKYVAKSCDALPAIRRLNAGTGELRVGGIRPWWASRHWGETMKDVRARRCAWSLALRLGAPTAPAGGVPADGAAVGLDLYQHRYANGGPSLPVAASASPL